MIKYEKTPLGMYKFNEDKNLNELKKHIDSTYDSHYSKEKFQAS